MAFFGNNDKALIEIQDDIIVLNRDVAELKAMLKMIQPLGQDYVTRLVELETKMAKLWTVLISVDNIKKEERPTKTARRLFGHRSP